MHLFDDIKAKGVTRNFNTKPNEKMHGPLKESYQLRTNFKNVVDQVSRFTNHIVNINCLLDSPYRSSSAGC